MLIDDILAYKDLGIGAVSMIIFYLFASKTRDDAMEQIKSSNKQSQDNQKEFIEAYKENTKAIQDLVLEFKEHIKTKEHALELLEEHQHSLEEKYNELKKYHE